MKYWHKIALQYMSKETTYFHIIQKNHSYILICVVSCAFQTTQFQIPQPTKYANSDSSSFNPDESLSDADSQTFMTPSTTDNSSQTFVTPSSFSTSNQNTLSTSSNDKSLPSSTNDNSLYKLIFNTPHTNIPSDRSRHSSNNQTTSFPPLIDRTTKTTYKLRQQPKLDYRLFITPSKL